jgi:glucose/arabinose dehydrogenase
VLRFLLAAAASSLALAGPAGAATVPPGFTDTEIASGLSAPTSMALAPDGRIFVLEQGGSVRVIENGQLLSTPFLTLNVDSQGERGLLGIAFDPSFTTNHFLYLYYTVPTPPEHNRVSRFTANGNVAVPGSEHVLLDVDDLSSATNHNGGGLHFGPDGRLFLGVGENATGSNSQTLTNLLGKLLRFNSDGTIPTDNPFYGSASGKNRAIWALGLRNPFTFAFQPGTGRLFINDVGQSTWEEIDEGTAGANYGWPTTEGPTNDPRFVGPLYAYQHSSGTPTGCAITGGAFYNPQQVTFPASYVGNYFFGDLCGGWIYRLDPGNGNAVSSFATGSSNPVDLLVTPGGDLLYLERGEGGAVHRISFGGGPGPGPTISSFSPTAGAAGSTGVTITGANLGGTNGVTFNGLPAAFSVTSDTAIHATVPNGATTGPIGVATPDGTATSASPFTVNFTVSGFSPTSGAPGTSVTINGAGFSFFSTARFNGATASTQVISPTQLHAVVPAGATSGPISVFRFGTPSTTTSATSFTVTGGGGGGSLPTISGFSPGSGVTGTNVGIAGTNFTGATSVKFNGRAAAFTVDSGTHVTATVPNGATSGRITVTTPAGTATSAASFIVTLSVTGFSPTSGSVGATVYVTGTGFTGASRVTFNGTPASFTPLGSSFISARVPAGATSGPIAVTTPAGTARSAASFLVH